MTPYEDTNLSQYMASDEYSNGQFDHVLDEFFLANCSDVDALMSRGMDKTEGYTEAPPNGSNASDWYTATMMGADDAYSSSLQAGSHLSIPTPSSGSTGGQRGTTSRWPPRSSAGLGHEVAGLGPPHTPPRSNGGSPSLTAAPSPASTMSWRRLDASRSRTASSSGSGSGTSDEADAKPDKTTPSSPLLHVATRSRNCAVMHVLLQRGAATIDERDVEGRTALHVAAGLGDKALVTLLVNEGADARLLDSRGRLALYYAVEKGHYDVVEMLLDRADEEEEEEE